MLGHKPLKVVRKTRVKGNTILVQTQDGYTYSNVDKAVNVDDSVMISVKAKNEVNQHLKLSKGSHVFIVGGTHVGEVAKVDDVIPGTMKRDKLVSLVEGDEKFQTNVQNIIVDTSTNFSVSAMQNNPLLQLSGESLKKRPRLSVVPVVADFYAHE